MATVLSRQPSASDLNSYYRDAPLSPKSSGFAKSQHSRKPSLTAWLGRSSGQAPSSPASKTMQISDPQPINPYDAAARAPGTLGKGATVVRTPQQALTANHFPSAETPNEKDELELSPVVNISTPASREATAPLVILQRESPARHDSPVPRRESPVPRRDSPVHRPAPSRGFTAPPGLRSLHTSRSYSHLQNSPRAASASLPLHRAAPIPLNLVSSSRQPLLRSALRPPSPTKSTNDAIGPFLPLLPPPRQTSKVTPPSSPLPPFHPVLLSGVPTHPIPPSQVIVTLETSTLSQRTTVATLTSRPSRLASFLQALVPSATQDSPTENDFASLFAHFAQAGLVSQTPNSHYGPIHIFLDRPSAPYAHILTYLRAGSNMPAALPRAASLALSAEPTRVEALCELRDEARYLELTELVELCDKELRVRAPRLRSTGSTSSLREKLGSGLEASGGRISSGPEVESRLKEFRFGAPAVEALQEEEDEEEPVELPPIIYERRGSHAGIVMTVPPRGPQQIHTMLGGSRALTRSPLPHGRMRTVSEVRYTQTQDGKLWI